MGQRWHENKPIAYYIVKLLRCDVGFPLLPETVIIGGGDFEGYQCCGVYCRAVRLSAVIPNFAPYDFAFNTAPHRTEGLSNIKPSHHHTVRF